MHCCWWRWKDLTPSKTPILRSTSTSASLTPSSSRLISHPWTTTSSFRRDSPPPCSPPPPSSVTATPTGSGSSHRRAGRLLTSNGPSTRRDRSGIYPHTVVTCQIVPMIRHSHISCASKHQVEPDSQWTETQSPRLLSLRLCERHKDHQACQLCTGHQRQAEICRQQSLLHSS